ncbi:MAG TPA: MBL fold metallo-hydrolase [Alphaproteobacteria bacterium]|nr:MBL fold metallo-hydrolase [Alphaproteobacteria bacterium]
MPALVQPFFDKATSTVSYVTYDAPGGTGAVIDPVLDYDAAAGRTRTASVEAILAFVAEQRLTIPWILETHVHADHLTAAAMLRERLGARIGIGASVVDVQERFAGVYNLPPTFRRDGSQFDHLFADGETLTIGRLSGSVLNTPGHTPDSVSYRIDDAVFVGDTLFMPDGGTARCDFPGGDARALYRSIRRLLSLPAETRIYVCHDYAPGGREIAWQTTVAEQRATNIHVRDGIGEDEFVALRTARDRTLSMPALIIPAVQVNITAGGLPAPEENGVSYLKVPLDTL